jgi:hypothetical protein
LRQAAIGNIWLSIEILEIKPGEDLLVRMRTEKPIPSLHYLKEINEIINVPSNRSPFAGLVK